MEGAADIDGKLITDSSPYWGVEQITEDGVYELMAPGGNTASVDRAMLIWPEVETYGVYRIGDMGDD